MHLFKTLCMNSHTYQAFVISFDSLYAFWLDDSSMSVVSVYSHPVMSVHERIMLTLPDILNKVLFFSECMVSAAILVL